MEAIKNFQETSHVILADITRHKGNSVGLIQQVDRYASGYRTAEIAWYVRPDQEYFLRDRTDLIVVEQGNYEGRNRAQRVSDWILELSQNGAAGHVFHVLSYDNWVLQAAGSLGGRNIRVEAKYMMDIRTRQYDGFRSAAPGPIVYQTDLRPLTFQEAAGLVQEVLRRGGHTSPATALPAAKLRPAMVALDTRAAKNPMDPESARLITSLIEAGRRQGWLGYTVVNGQSGWERVWLETGPATTPSLGRRPSQLRATNDRHFTAGVPDAPTRGSFLGNFSETAPSLLSRAEPEEPNRTDITVVEYPTASESGEDVRLTLRPEVAPPADSSREKPRKKDLYLLKLRERGIGSPVVPREHLYAAVEEVLAKDAAGGITAGRLKTLARERARQTAATAGYDREQNWEAISDCFFRMLVLAEVLLMADGNTPVREGIGSQCSQVCSLRSDFRDRCEAALLEHIIREVEVTQSDYFSLGLALYQRGDPTGTPRDELTERIDALLTLLQKEGRVELVNGLFVADKGFQG
jgi:hypothetical protein